MRFLTGVILGCLLTVGVAWFHDLDVDVAQPGQPAHRMVNWEVVNANMSHFTATVRAEWDKLTDRRG
jgi:hypothetical protein